MNQPYHPRWLEYVLKAPRSRGKVRLLLGARQTGKSSLLRALSPSDATFINLQDPRVRLRYERAPGTLAAEMEAEKKKRLWVAVDEIQKVPGILDEIQFLHDRYPGRFQFFLTGSSARRLRTR